ncbi:MAG: WD40 repeat domain-containing protein [Terricaulis sp.]
MTPDGSRIITTTADGDGGIWDAHTGAQIAPFAGHTWNYGLRGYVTARGQFSPDGSRYLARGDDGLLHAWDTHTGVALVRFDVDEIGGVYSPDGSRIATHAGLNISLWDAESGALLGATQLRSGGMPPLAGILEMTFGHGGERIYASGGGRLIEWNIGAMRRGH